MNTRLLILFIFLSGWLTAGEPPAFVFSENKIALPPLLLAETLGKGIRAAPEPAEDSPWSINSSHNFRPQLVSRMPILLPKNVDPRMPILVPDASVDYKLIVKSSSLEAGK